MVDTPKVQDRRKLRFNSIAEVLADVERIVEADRAGTLRSTGNWTPGQTFGHLASWINYAYEGFPMKVPWPIRFLIRRMKGRYLRKGMPAGVKIPGAANGTHGTEPLSTEEGAQRLRAALKRLADGEPGRYDSPAFGPMSLEERIALNLRHAELHLSFLHPEG